MIDEAGRTLGEFDYVLRDRVQERYVHLELAVKFYLAVERDGTWQFRGPIQDNWGRKLEQLPGHQLRLAANDASRAMLRERFGIESLETRQLIYGRLFLPFSHEASGVALDEMSPRAHLGRWLHCADLPRWLPELSDAWILPKPLWPVGLSRLDFDSLEPVSVGQLLELARERCTMFALPDRPDPVFLVPDAWAATTGVGGAGSRSRVVR